MELTYRAADSFPSCFAGYRSPSPVGEKSEPWGNLNGCLSHTVGEPGMVVWLIPQQARDELLLNVVIFDKRREYWYAWVPLMARDVGMVTVVGRRSGREARDLSDHINILHINILSNISINQNVKTLLISISYTKKGENYETKNIVDNRRFELPGYLFCCNIC